MLQHYFSRLFTDSLVLRLAPHSQNSLVTLAHIHMAQWCHNQMTVTWFTPPTCITNIPIFVTCVVGLQMMVECTCTCTCRYPGHSTTFVTKLILICRVLIYTKSCDQLINWAIWLEITKSGNAMSLHAPWMLTKITTLFFTMGGGSLERTLIYRNLIITCIHYSLYNWINFK